MDSVFYPLLCVCATSLSFWRDAQGSLNTYRTGPAAGSPGSRAPAYTTRTATMVYQDRPRDLLLHSLPGPVLAPTSVCFPSTKESFRSSSPIKPVLCPAPSMAPSPHHRQSTPFCSHAFLSLVYMGTSHASYDLGGLSQVTCHIHYVLILLMELSGNYLIFLISISVFGGHLPGVFAVLTVMFSAIVYSPSSSPSAEQRLPSAAQTLLPAFDVILNNNNNFQF